MCLRGRVFIRKSAGNLRFERFCTQRAGSVKINACLSAAGCSKSAYGVRQTTLSSCVQRGVIHSCRATPPPLPLTPQQRPVSFGNLTICSAAQVLCELPGLDLFGPLEMALKGSRTSVNTMCRQIGCVVRCLEKAGCYVSGA